MNHIKFLFRSFFVSLFCALFISFIPSLAPVQAHAMLPPEVLEYIKENPEATYNEFEEFMALTYGQEMADSLYDGAGELDKDAPAFKDLDTFFGEDPNDPNTLSHDTPDLSSEEVSKIQEDAALIMSVKNENKDFFTNAFDFVVLGIEHILIGLDHILFVVSLILVLAPRRRILAMITLFTLAHSLTLILAGTQILTLSAKIVEPLIAFSIAYIAITSVFFKHISFFKHHKLNVIFLFGLFHGLGFAGVFSELSIPSEQYLSSLLFFNVGVEIGQILILAITLPILYLLNRDKRAFEIFTQITAALISILSLYWVIERIFL